MASSNTILRHIAELPESSVITLYKNVWTVVAVLRALPPLARQLVMRLAFLDAPADVSPWVAGALDSQNDRLSGALAEMKQVYLLAEQATSSSGGVDPRAVQLNPTFREQLQKALSQRDTSPWAKGRDMTCSDECTQPHELRKWAQGRWESLLHYMVAPDSSLDGTRPEPGWKPQKEVKDQLLAKRADGTCLMMKPAVTSAKISQAGFQFLLRPLKAQVWQLLIDMVHRRREDKREAGKADDLLVMLFQLSFCTLGAGYSMDDLKKSQQELMGLLGMLGIVYVRPSAPRRFYPTHLVVEICSDVAGGMAGDGAGGGAGGSAGGKSLQGEGYLIIETNFRVYAYTTSVLQQKVMELFAKVDIKLPHMVIGVITRTSIRNALVRGISARQIIEYLDKHAHPQCLVDNARPPVPVVVTDQIKFWEQESKRIRAEDACAYTRFISPQLFEEAKQKASEMTYIPGETPEDQNPEASTALLYSDTSEQILVVAAARGGDMKTFLTQS